MADILLAAELSPTGFGRFVVIKSALSKFSDNEEFKDMFKNEGKVACNLKHKNIITIHEFGIERNQFFLAMEYLSGKNLREFIKKMQARNTALSIPNIIYIIKEIAAGLNYAHNAIDANTGQPLNIIHRDVSPQNVMLTFDGQIKLIDFGIAKIDDTNLTKAGHLKGKFSYMSPEQANGHELDERADIFCLGIIFWELLTDKRLFASSNELVSLKKVRNCDIPDARKINPDISSKLNSILNKSLNKNKSSRYATAAKLERDLNLYLNKNYPEYSHYDFITLMKQTYRKEIMSERENLKTYSVEFKKYTNSLNLEKTFKTPIILEIPDITSLNQKQATQTSPDFTKSVLDKKTENTNRLSNQALSNPSGFFETQTSKTNPTRKPLSEKSTTLIHQNNLTIEKNDTKTKESLSAIVNHNNKKTQLMTGMPLNIKSRSTELKIEKLPQQTTNRSKLTSTILSQYSKDWVEKPNKFSFKKVVFFSFVFLIIGSFGAGMFWIFKNQNEFTTTAESPPIAIPAPEPLALPSKTTDTTAKRKPTYANQNKKLFIRSNPSNAGIYINNQFISKYTPSLLNLKLDSTILITVKKQGFLSRNIKINSQNFQNRIFVNLEKDNNIPKTKTLIIQ